MMIGSVKRIKTSHRYGRNSPTYPFAEGGTDAPVDAIIFGQFGCTRGFVGTRRQHYEQYLMSHMAVDAVPKRLIKIDDHKEIYECYKCEECMHVEFVECFEGNERSSEVGVALNNIRCNHFVPPADVSMFTIMSQKHATKFGAVGKLCTFFRTKLMFSNMSIKEYKTFSTKDSCVEEEESCTTNPNEGTDRVNGSSEVIASASVKTATGCNVECSVSMTYKTAKMGKNVDDKAPFVRRPRICKLPFSQKHLEYTSSESDVETQCLRRVGEQDNRQNGAGAEDVMTRAGDIYEMPPAVKVSEDVIAVHMFRLGFDTICNDVGEQKMLLYVFETKSGYSLQLPFEHDHWLLKKGCIRCKFRNDQANWDVSSYENEDKETCQYYGMPETFRVMFKPVMLFTEGPKFFDDDVLCEDCVLPYYEKEKQSRLTPLLYTPFDGCFFMTAPVPVGYFGNRPVYSPKFFQSMNGFYQREIAFVFENLKRAEMYVKKKMEKLACLHALKVDLTKDAALEYGVTSLSKKLEASIDKLHDLIKFLNGKKCHLEFIYDAKVAFPIEFLECNENFYEEKLEKIKFMTMRNECSFTLWSIVFKLLKLPYSNSANDEAFEFTDET